MGASRVMCQFQIRPRQRHARWRITNRENERGRRKRRGRLAEAARRRFLGGVRQARATPRGRWVRRQPLVTSRQGITRDSPLLLGEGKINIVCARFQALRPPCEASAGNPWHLHELILFSESDVNQAKHTLRHVSLYYINAILN